jgi:hypothetical protein
MVDILLYELIFVSLTFPLTDQNMNVQMGDLIPRKTSPVAEHQHPVIEGSPRRGSYGSGDLRFEALSVQTRDGSYPLHMAVSNRSSLHVLDMLINAGPEVVFWTNKHGETPLPLGTSRPFGR